jgi:endonuclease/exonuclease/phosphatase family metal-dependent hydrolase
MRKLLPLTVIVALLSALPALPALPLPNSVVATRSRLNLRVMTYNIHVGVGMDKKLDLQRIADVINLEHPDLVGLQEVDRGVKRTEGIDEIAELARLTRMQFAFAHNLDYQGGQYGVAILSRFPILHIDHRKYENKREAERRGMLRIEINARGRKLSFVTTHLDYQYADGRLFETEQLLAFLKDQTEPLIVVGDFNEEAAGEAYKLMSTRFRDAWLDARQNSAGLSYPADKPAKRIDFIFYGTRNRMQTRKAWIPNTLASDHLPVVADLELH